MLMPPGADFAGWKVTTIGNDKLYAINPEAGRFGAARSARPGGTDSMPSFVLVVTHDAAVTPVLVALDVVAVARWAGAPRQ